MNNIEKVFRFAAYVRVSTGKQAEDGLSLDAQEERIARFAEGCGAIVVDVYREEGRTGKNDNRPAWQSMIARCTSPERPYDAIVVNDVSRLFRNTELLSKYRAILYKHDVDFICLSEGIRGYSPSTKYQLTIMGANAEYESDRISERSTLSMRRNAELGFFNGGPIPFGYESTQVTDTSSSNRRQAKILTVLEAEASIVKIMYEKAAYGHRGKPAGCKKIASLLNDRGLLNRGRQWTKMRVGEILNNSTYKGERITCKLDTAKGRMRPPEEWVRQRVSPIVSEELWEDARQALCSRQVDNLEYRGFLSDHLLTGIAVCGYCGSNMRRTTGKDTKYEYYTCGKKEKEGAKACICKPVPLTRFESAVKETILSKVLTPHRLDLMFREIQKLSREKSKEIGKLRLSLQRKRNSLNAEINKLYKLVGQGKLDDWESLQRFVKEAENELSKTDREIERLRAVDTLPLKKIGVEQRARALKGIKRQLVDTDKGVSKAYLRSVTDKIVVKNKGATIGGNKAELVKMVSNWMPGDSPKVVPGSVSKWWAQKDLNLRPADYESDALTS